MVGLGLQAGINCSRYALHYTQWAQGQKVTPVKRSSLQTCFMEYYYEEKTSDTLAGSGWLQGAESRGQAVDSLGKGDHDEQTKSR
jgi:hypothetical protein